MANNTWSLDFLTIKNVAFFTGNEKKDIKEKHRHSVLSYTLFLKKFFIRTQASDFATKLITKYEQFQDLIIVFKNVLTIQNKRNKQKIMLKNT